MPRFAVKITVEEFKKKLIEAIKNHDDYSDYFDKEDSDEEILNYGAGGIIRSLNKKVDKDLSKVVFNLENFDCENSSFGYNLGGIQTFENGFTFLGCAAGGDWEEPVFFIIYWDGSAFRGYIPSEGNMWNKKYNTAYGSEEENEDYEEESEEDSAPKTKADKEAIKEDIKKRIIIK